MPEELSPQNLDGKRVAPTGNRPIWCIGAVYLSFAALRLAWIGQMRGMWVVDALQRARIRGWDAFKSRLPLKLMKPGACLRDRAFRCDAFADPDAFLMHAPEFVSRPGIKSAPSALYAAQDRRL
jgi:hypothetical protein